MENLKGGTENQGNQGEGKSLIMGKYKSPEEAFAALDQLERQNNDLKEALDREQRLNQLLESVETTPKSKEYIPVNHGNTGTPELFEDEEKSRKFNELLAAREQTIWQRVDSLVEKKVKQFESKRQANEYFYGKYPELKDFTDRVDIHASRLGMELGEKAGKMPIDKLAQEVASRVKSELAETKKKLASSTLHIEGGSMSEPSSETKSSVSSSSEEERASNYFKEEVQARKKKQFGE